MADSKPGTLTTVTRGRPMRLERARRFVAEQREKVTLQAWKAAPQALGYLASVVAGEERFDEGRYKSAQAILSRTLPTITSQAIVADSRSVTMTTSAFDFSEAVQSFLENREKYVVQPTDTTPFVEVAVHAEAEVVTAGAPEDEAVAPDEPAAEAGPGNEGTPATAEVAGQ